jgi:predicted Rossmann fold nucleotide-binding protein DprA/Smf involved in DNA uptake
MRVRLSYANEYGGMRYFNKVGSIGQNNPPYPISLKKYLSDKTSASVSVIGNVDLLQNKPLAIFSSSKCPGNIILKTYDLMKRIRDSGLTVISGFHSPMEQECLTILLKGKQPVIFCPARSIEGMRIKPESKKRLEDGKLLMLSPFTEKARRISSERALERNRFIAAIADKIFIPYAEPNSKTETFCRELISWGKPVYTLPESSNQNIIKLGAKSELSFIKNLNHRMGRAEEEISG